jgi:hypothetical protein
MPGFRDAAQKEILKIVGEIDQSGHNVKLYVQKFEDMSDAEFGRFIDELENGTERLCMVMPNFSDVKITFENNCRVAELLDYSFFQRIYMPAREGLPAYLTPIPYPIFDLPLRRQAQLLEKKISIPADNNSVDNLTGQVTGPSKGSKISWPETEVIASMGLDKSLTELLTVRGGDPGAYNAMSALIQRTGYVSLKDIEPYATGVKSKKALNVLLNSMMLSSTL